MRIGMLLEGEFPPDQRVEKEIDALLAAGHEIHIFTPTFSKRQRHETLNGVLIHRFSIGESLFKKIRSTVVRLSLYTFIWKKLILKQFKQYPFEVIHVHDLPLARCGYQLATRLKIKLVLDLHENFPAFFESSGNDKGVLKKYFHDYALWQQYEKWAVSAADEVLVVVDEALSRFASSRHGNDNFTVVSNTVPLDYLQRATAAANPDGLTLSYIGGFNAHRGLETVIKAMPGILAHAPGTTLLLVGEGRIQPELEALAMSLGIQEQVQFTGWIPFSEVAAVIAKSDICLVPHASTEHTNTTIPHKLFQYMAMSKPVLVSDCPPLKRIVCETGAGSVFTAGDHESLTAAVQAMAKQTVRQRFGDNGYQAIKSTYNWTIDGDRLTNVYESIL